MLGIIAGAALALALGAPASVDDTYPPEQPVGPSLNATASAECVSDAPWVTYDITLVDPDGLSTSRDAFLVFDKGDEHLELALGTFGPDNRLAGTVLWPGSAVDASGTGSDWPGWVLADGQWSDVGEGDLGWTREGATISIEVNPEVAVAATYPPSTPGCVLHPRGVQAVVAAPAQGAPPQGALAATGPELLAPLMLGGGLVAGGLAFANARRRPRE